MPLRDEIAAWCTGRRWWWRAPLLAYLGFGGIRLRDDVEFCHPFNGLTLGVHEAGHLLFGWFGELPGVAGGRLMQALAPIRAAGSCSGRVTGSASRSRRLARPDDPGRLVPLPGDQRSLRGLALAADASRRGPRLTVRSCGVSVHSAV